MKTVDTASDSHVEDIHRVEPPRSIPEECGRRLSLSELPAGEDAVVCEMCGDQQAAQMLQAMGLGPSARVRMARRGEPCIVHVLGLHGRCCRIGLERRLAKQMVVTHSA